ncbi:Aspartate-semialdehyde dehydrogenase [Rothia kristinae]|nr:Aspartate-semialdehyde dehydrogenase [Rothia kristinae]
MVGSVLMQRLEQEGDFADFTPVFFSTSAAGSPAPTFRGAEEPSTLQDAHDLDELALLPVIVTTQGGDYTKAVHGKLRERGWDGLWIDAASTLRQEPAP